MGYLLHGSHEYAFEDRLLAHLKMVIGQKLMKQEGFFLSWAKSAEEGSGRLSVWMSPHVNIAFRMSGERIELNPTWIRALSATSHTQRGLVVMSEEEAEKYAKRAPDLV